MVSPTTGWHLLWLIYTNRRKNTWRKTCQKYSRRSMKELLNQDSSITDSSSIISKIKTQKLTLSSKSMDKVHKSLKWQAKLARVGSLVKVDRGRVMNIGFQSWNLNQRRMLLARRLRYLKWHMSKSFRELKRSNSKRRIKGERKWNNEWLFNIII